jgi:hypothetical protein
MDGVLNFGRLDQNSQECYSPSWAYPDNSHSIDIDRRPVAIILMGNLGSQCAYKNRPLVYSEESITRCWFGPRSAVHCWWGTSLSISVVGP